MNSPRSVISGLETVFSPRKIELPTTNKLLPAAVVALMFGFSTSAALAQTTSPEINEMKNTIRELQKKIESIQATQAKQQSNTIHADATGAAHSDKYDGIQAGPLNIKFGGFVEFASIYRDRNETADIGSNWNAIPYANASGHYLSEFRETARQSRISMLITGPNDGHQHGEAYYEMDFAGAAQTANSKESNSYNPRVRHVYATYYNDDSGFYMLGGQTWSLLTQEKKGMNPRDEMPPMTIDAQYVPGFNWTRNAQIRFVEKFSPMISAGFSVESPQALFAGKAPSGVVFTNTGGSMYNNANSYTFDSAPDLIAKVALDPGWGHYELYAMNRWFRDRQVGNATSNGKNNTKTAASVGGSVLLPLVPKMLDFQASFLTGKGVGRYGSAQLPDATFNANGDIEAMKGTTALVGLVDHATDAIDLYAYWGMEKVDRSYDAIVSGGGAITGYTGYGIPTTDLSGCEIEGSACAANTSKVSQGTLGGWWKFYRGTLGNMQLGLQASYTKQEAFSGLNGQSPDTNMKVAMASFRYYPYQN